MENGGEGEREALRQGESSATAEEGSNARRPEPIQYQWLTVDGPLGVDPAEALKLSHNFFYGGFCLLPWLWFANCFYFWPVLRHRQLDPPARVYVLWSAICCLTFTIVLLGWSLTFTIGGKGVFGTSWQHLSVYNLADKFQTALES